MAHRSDRRRTPAANRTSVGVGYSDRITIVGRAGSGKSSLLRHLILRCPRAVLIDVKQDGPIPAAAGWHYTHGLAEFRRDFPKYPRIVAQPGPTEDSLTWFDEVCWRCYRVGTVAVGIDDLPGELTIGGQKSSGLEILYKQGRSRHVMPIGCVQRAKSIPLVMLSEASQLYVFQLLIKEDRERIRDVIGDFPLPRHEHGFTFARPALSTAIECAPLRLK